MFLGIKGPFSELILSLIWWYRLKWVCTDLKIWKYYKFLRILCLWNIYQKCLDFHTAHIKHNLLLLLVTFLSFFLFLPFPHNWKIVRTGDNRLVLHCKHIVFPSQNAMMNIYKANKSNQLWKLQIILLPYVHFVLKEICFCLE